MTYTELKIELMQLGARFSSDARQAMRKSRFGQITFFDYATTGGVVLRLGGRVYANVPVKFADTPFLLHREKDGFALFRGEERLPVSVEIIPVPRYALDAIRLEDGTPVRELVMTHADRVRISPVSGCSFHCHYCTCNASRYQELPLEKLDAAFRVALEDPYNKPRHALISGGTPRESEDSYRWLNQVYRFFPSTYPNMDFDVMCSPRGLYPNQSSAMGDRDFLRFLREECGIKTMSVNLELFGDEARVRFIPEKAALGKDRYAEFLRNAVEIFGAGRIRSSLVVGLEPTEDTLRGVEFLLDCGCIPVLSAFVPAPGTGGATLPAPEPAFLLDLVGRAEITAQRAGLCLGPLCRPCTHNSITWEPYQVKDFAASP